jgi:hypothetical protein
VVTKPKPTLDEELDLISEDEYAEFVGKTIPSVRNERSAGKGPPYVRLHGNFKYFRKGVLKYVAEHTVVPGREPTMTDARPRRGNSRRQPGA